MVPRGSLELKSYCGGPCSHKSGQVVPGRPRSSRTVHGQVARRGEKYKSSERRASRMRDARIRKGGGGSGETAVDESNKETADRVARRQVD